MNEKLLEEIRDILTRIDRKLGDDPCPAPVKPPIGPMEPMKPWWETMPSTAPPYIPHLWPHVTCRVVKG